MVTPYPRSNRIVHAIIVLLLLAVNAATGSLNPMPVAAAAPTIEMLSPINVTSNSADFRANILDMMGNANAWATFLWGTYPDASTPAPTQTITSTGIVTHRQTGLSADTTYYYRLVVESPGGIGYGSPQSFRTLTATTPPIVLTLQPSMTESGCVMNGYLDSMGTASIVDVKFRYFNQYLRVITTSGNFPSDTTPSQAMSSTGPFSARIGLPEGNWCYRAEATAGGHGSASGEYVVLDIPRWLSGVITRAPSSITSTTATLNARGSTNGEVYFEYGPTTNYGSSTPRQYLPQAGDFNSGVTGLSAGTAYNCRAVIVTTRGTSYGNNITFTTANSGTTPPTVETRTATVSADGVITINGYLTALGTATSVQTFFSIVSISSDNQMVHFFNSPKQTMTAPGPFSYNDLYETPDKPDLNYCAYADAGIHGSARGQALTYSSSTTAIVTNPATAITSTTTTLNAQSSAAGQAYFQYGITTSYGSTTPVQTLTSGGPLSASLTGLTAGITYNYRAVLVKTSGTSYGQNRTFITANSGTTPPSVETHAATGITTAGCTLNGYLVSLGTASSVSVFFTYAQLDNEGNAAGSGSTPGIPMTAPAPFSHTVSWCPMWVLQPMGEASYWANADGGVHGSARGAAVRIPTIPVTTAITNEASNVTSTSGTLNGQASTAGQTYFEYGTTTSYGSSTPTQTLTSGGLYNSTLTNLSASTTYNYRAVLNNGTSGTSCGQNRTFTTANSGTRPPSVETRAVTGISQDTTTLNGYLTNMGTALSVSVYFCYQYLGVAASRSMTPSTTMTAPGPFSQTILVVHSEWLRYNSSNAEEIEYYAIANGGIHGSASGAKWGVRLPQEPETSAVSVALVAATAATISGNMSWSPQTSGGQQSANGLTDANRLKDYSPTQVSFEYGTTTAYGSTTPTQTATAPGPFSANLTGLTPATVYHARSKLMSTELGTYYGDDVSFRTANNGTTPPAVTTGAATAVSNGKATLNGNLTALGTATTANVFFLFGPVRREGWTPANTYPQALTATGIFSAAMAGIRPGETYRFQAVADGGVNGRAAGNQTTFTMGGLSAETILSQGLDTDSIAVVNVGINRGKNSGGTTTSIPGGISSYQATAIVSPAGGIGLLAARGVEPFANPTINTSTGVFGVADVTWPQQVSNSTLVRLVVKLTGDCNTNYVLNVPFQTISAADGQANIPEDSTKSLTFRRGDAKPDGVVNVFDAMYIAQYIVGTRQLSELGVVNAACVKHDGVSGDKLDVFDAMFIAQMIVGLRNNRFE
ncbi:MAG: dockerin type I repeat-containing protein [Chloroflexota bacterium]